MLNSQINKFIPFSFNKRLFIILSIGFIISTMVGTLAHEYGHYIVAKKLGYNARISYGFVHWWSDNENQPLTKDSQFTILHQHPKDNIWIAAGGPLSTMITGSMGLAFLFAFKKRYLGENTLSFPKWIIIFPALFWLRQIANFMFAFEKYVFFSSHSVTGDEFGLSHDLSLPAWTISAITAVMGVAVLLVVIFKFIPLNQRFTFVISGLIGGLTGYILWLLILGPILMP